MIPGINPKQMKEAMKRLGIKQEEIDANEVIIRTDNKEIIIKDPVIAKINMMGQDTFQISGQIIERSIEKFTQEDIKIVAEQANVSHEEAKKALEKEGDLASAILSLK